jgi:outer membrane receptor for ferrienterochelin and colicin
MLHVSHRAARVVALQIVTGVLLTPSILCAQTENAVAIAQSLPEMVAGKRVFQPTYFSADSPQNAADMVNRVPGFSIDNGDNVRGFGGAAGNVLIDGARPTSKDEGLQSILGRIPANNVERIELLEGGAASALAPGKTQVVNVVRKADAKAGGNWEVQTTFLSNMAVLPSVEASYTSRIGPFNLTLGIDAGIREREFFVGYEGILNPSGQFLEQGPNDDRRRFGNGEVSFAADATLGAYKLNFNARGEQTGFARNAVAIAIRTGETLPFRVDEIVERNASERWEIGADIERDLFGWTSKLALLAKGDESQGSSLAGFNRVSQVRSYDRFVSDDLSLERVARSTFKRKFGTHQVEMGGEIAYNSLDTTGVFSQGNGTNFVVQASDISSTKVEEDRKEAFISDSWAISPRLTLEGTLTGEWSTISQSGDAAKERSFFYPKPRIKIEWKPTTRWTYRASVDREIGQLDFGAFADSASVSDGNQNSGNPELRPDQSWAYRAGLEKRWGNRGVFGLGLVYKQIEDQLALVPTSDGGVALGNVPEATLWGYSLSWTVPLTDWIKGLELEGSYRWRDTELLDPLTGTTRSFSGETGKQFEANARYDIPARKLKMGAWIWQGEHRLDFRPTQRYEWSTYKAWGMWIETTAIKGFSLEFGLENPDGVSINRVRTDYVPDRRAGIVASSQYRERNKDGIWYLLFKGKI